MDSNGEWDGVTERRKSPEPTHVSLDHLSGAIEGRLSRLESSFERLEQILERAIKAGLRVLRWVVGLVGLLVVGAFSVGGWVMLQEEQIEQRPTREIVVEMIDRKTAEATDALTDEIAAVKAEGRVARDANTQGLVALQLIVEALREQSASLRRDVDRHDRMIR